MVYDICKKCQRFFDKSGKLYCDKCENQLNESREKVNSYLQINPNATIIEIVKQADISLKDVNIFLETSAAISYDSEDRGTINLRDEEVQKEKKQAEKRKKLKMKNNFSTRRLKN